MKSIRRQLTFTLLPGFALLLFLSSAAIYVLTRAALLGEFDASLQSKALTIMSQAEQSEAGIKFEEPDGFYDQLNSDATPRFYELLQADGTICARSASLNGVDLAMPAFLSAKAMYWNVALPSGFAGRAIGLAFTPKSESEDNDQIKQDSAFVMVAADRRALDQTLATLAAVLMGAGLLAIATAVPLVNFSLRRSHAPLGELARLAAGITADSLQSRFPVESMPEDLRPITTRLNELLGRLESSFERERRFSADLAHELRTPLAELRALS